MKSRLNARQISTEGWLQLLSFVVPASSEMTGRYSELAGPGREGLDYAGQNVLQYTLHTMFHSTADRNYFELEITDSTEKKYDDM